MRNILLLFFAISLASNALGQEKGCIKKYIELSNKEMICWGNWTNVNGILVSVRGPVVEHPSQSNTGDERLDRYIWGIRLKSADPSKSYSFTINPTDINHNGPARVGYTWLINTVFTDEIGTNRFTTLSAGDKIYVDITDVEELTTVSDGSANKYFNRGVEWYHQKGYVKRKLDAQGKTENKNGTNSTGLNNEDTNENNTQTNTSSNNGQLGNGQIKEKILENLKNHLGKGKWQHFTNDGSYTRNGVLSNVSVTHDNYNLIIKFHSSEEFKTISDQSYRKVIDEYDFECVYSFSKLVEIWPEQTMFITFIDGNNTAGIQKNSTTNGVSTGGPKKRFNIPYDFGANNANFNELKKLISQLNNGSIGNGNTLNVQPPTKEALEKAKIEKQKADEEAKQQQEAKRQQEEAARQQEAQRLLEVARLQEAAKQERSGKLRQAYDEYIKAGDDAYKAKNYELAISSYTSALTFAESGQERVMVENKVYTYAFNDGRGFEAYVDYIISKFIEEGYPIDQNAIEFTLQDTYKRCNLTTNGLKVSILFTFSPISNRGMNVEIEKNNKSKIDKLKKTALYDNLFKYTKRSYEVESERKIEASYKEDLLITNDFIQFYKNEYSADNYVGAHKLLEQKG